MIQLRPYQTEGVDAIYNYFAQGGKGNPVLAWPTGTGKSVVPAAFIRGVLSIFPHQRFIIATHVKELIQQNARIMLEVWPGAPIGIYSAGLKRRDMGQQIMYCGIASAVKCPQDFGHVDILFIDECHLLSPNDNTMYMKFIAALIRVNPFMKVVGLSATPFRMGQGLITDGGLFTDICHNLCSVEAFNRLIAEGFISPLVPRKTKVELDVSRVRIASTGDFAGNELQKAVDIESVIHNALLEACELGANRGSWLCFASGVDHAEHIAAKLKSFGIAAEAVHSKLSGEVRDQRIRDFKSGKLRAITNNNVLTTGFDHPPIDFIVMLRPTMSPGLWVQMLGRGTRPCPEMAKQNCLVADFAGNTRRLGPINDPVIPKKRSGDPGEAPIKLCDFCGVYNHIRAVVCTACGQAFTFEVKIKSQADTEQLLRFDLPEVHHYDVNRVIYSLHKKNGKPDSIKVTYICGLQAFYHWVCLEHGGLAAKKARDWWRQHHMSEPPTTTAEALAMTTQLRQPKRIRVHTNTMPQDVLSYEF